MSQGIRQVGHETPTYDAPASDFEKDNKTTPSSPTATPSEAEVEAVVPISCGGADDTPSSLRSAFKLACISSFVLTFILDFLLPMPMFFSHYIFSKGFFTAWVVISFVWVFVSSMISCFLPIWETRTFWGQLWRRIRRGDVVSRT